MSRLIGRRTDPGPSADVDEAITAAVQSDAALTDPVIAARDRQTAADARQRAAQARRDADTALAEARQEAQRLISEAETRARTLTAAAKADDEAAERLERHATMVERAHELDALCDAAERHLADLGDEYATVTARAQELGTRLADLGRQREDAAAALAGAREAGDVAAVMAARAAMSAIDEVSAVTARQAEVAQGRARAIGETGWDGEYDQGAAAAAALHQERSDLLDQLDPTRAPRRLASTAADYTRALTAAGVPEDEALQTAALLVAIGQHPEAAAALFAVPEEAVTRTQAWMLSPAASRG